MICEICKKNNATTIGLVEEKNKYLCGSCYKKFVCSDELINIINTVQKETKINKFCKNCGTTLDDIKTTGLFGCPMCYQEFNDLIITKGNCLKNCSNTPHLFEIKEKIKNYNQLIEKALLRADYEVANNLAEKINALRSKYDAKL